MVGLFITAISDVSEAYVGTGRWLKSLGLRRIVTKGIAIALTRELSMPGAMQSSE